MRVVRARTLLGLVALVLLLVSIRAGWVSDVRGVSRAVTGPVERAAGRSGETIGGVLASVLSVTRLTERVRALELELANAAADRAREESIAQENDRLRAELGLLPRERFSLLSADVIGPTTDGLSDAVRINRGSTNGIPLGAPVIVADGVVVGRVSDVAASGATIDLVTSGRVRVTVRDLATKAEGIVRGVRGLDVTIEGVPRTETLRVGDRLVTTGIDGVFPPHLFVGTIKTVRAPEHAIFQEGTVQPPLDLHRLRTVAVIIGP